MPHPCNNIVPVSIPQVQVRFLREKKRSLEPVRGENLGQFSEKDLDKYTSDDLALILQINHKDPASLDSVKNSLFRQRVCLVKQSRFHQNLESGSQSFADTVMATPRLHCLDQSRESQISPSLKILPDSGEDFGRSRRQIQGMTPTGAATYGTDAEWQEVIARVRAVPAYLVTAEQQITAGVAAGMARRPDAPRAARPSPGRGRTRCPRDRCGDA